MEFADWTRAFAMVGDSPVGWKAVLLAEDGSMYALLQGMTPDDELRTVRLDDEGRISAFIIDSADAWGQMLSIGNAELAARLDALMSYDRRGLYQYGTAFKDGWSGWDTDLSGGDAAAVLTPVTFESGGYSVRLVGGKTADFSAELFRRLSIIVSDRIGIEANISLDGIIDAVEVGATYYDVHEQHIGALRYDDVENELQIYEPGDTWTPFKTAFGLPTGLDTFCTFKVVFDTDTNKYIRALVAGVEYDLSAYTVSTGPAPPSTWIKAQIKVFSRNGENDGVYVDHVIVTNQEPE